MILILYFKVVFAKFGICFLCILFKEFKYMLAIFLSEIRAYVDFDQLLPE